MSRNCRVCWEGGDLSTGFPQRPVLPGWASRSGLPRPLRLIRRRRALAATVRANRGALRDDEPPFLAATDFTLSSEKRQRGNSPSQFPILELGGTSMPPMRAVVATVRNLLKGVTLTRGSLGC